MRNWSAAIYAAGLVLAAAAAPPLHAQDGYQISQRGSIAQTLGRTRVALDYSRPLWRNRDDLFGKVVHWGELWTPGANMATVLDVSHDVKVNGRDVPAGRWSMWIIPSRVGRWELVLDARDSLFHTQRPDLTPEQIVIPLELREDAEHAEALTWSFPRIAQNGATLRMNWAHYEIPLEMEVESIEPSPKVSAEEADRFVGKWHIENLPIEGWPDRPPNTLTITYDTVFNVLIGTFPPGLFAPPTDTASKPDYTGMTPQERERAEARHTLAAFEATEFSYVLVPQAEGVFLMGWMDETGQLLEAGFLFHEFEFDGSRATSLVMRDLKDRITARGTREK
jgi:hypothetical protein